MCRGNNSLAISNLVTGGGVFSLSGNDDKNAVCKNMFSLGGMGAEVASSLFRGGCTGAGRCCLRKATVETMNNNALFMSGAAFTAGCYTDNSDCGSTHDLNNAVCTGNLADIRVSGDCFDND